MAEIAACNADRAGAITWWKYLLGDYYFPAVAA
jgi:hypothetical protein